MQGRLSWGAVAGRCWSRHPSRPIPSPCLIQNRICLGMEAAAPSSDGQRRTVMERARVVSPIPKPMVEPFQGASSSRRRRHGLPPRRSRSRSRRDLGPRAEGSS
ncbi:hypothetical protein PVAP13_5NG358724 [Panicum virgatum]|uniref:Uncharacterized protein n=1 Tax=Panicum virgatum TaxID=38727 RepID=A0A8T0RQG6_PANVG|nr:hypothetical protein PVAP13_5NG358724 [Panicum virgatum]